MYILDRALGMRETCYLSHAESKVYSSRVFWLKCILKVILLKSIE
jgi:hypothetical protein